MAKSLGQLLSESWAFFTKNFTVILIGAIIFGLITAGTQVMLGRKVMQVVPSMMGDVAVDPAKMEEVTKRMMEGDPSAEAEFTKMMEDAMKPYEGMSEDQVAAAMQGKAMGFIGALLPSIGIAVLLSILIGIVASAYYMIVALGMAVDAGAAFQKVPSVVLPIIGLWLWLFIRTFAWIPFIGIITAIILGPRFIAAPVLLLAEKRGVFESATLSYKATTGYWGKILGNCIVLGLIFIGIFLVVGFLNGMIMAVSPAVGMSIQQILGSLASAFGIVFCVQLAVTVLKNPRKV